MPSIIPGGELASDPVRRDFDYYYDQAREICRRVRDKAHLTDDEIIVLALVAAQLALAKYVVPGERESAATLNQIMSVLDHGDVNAVIASKMDRLLEGPRTSAREDAPSGAIVEKLGVCKDSDEPAGS
jgi:hypothetical protein